MKYLRLLFLALLPMLPQHAFPAPPDWHGEYVYSASHGSTKGGSAIVADYVVRLSGSTEAGGCEIEISGFQTFEEIVCVAREAGSSVSLSFRSYKSGDVKNIHGEQVYRPGQELLVFERVAKNGRSALMTRWVGLTGLDGSRPANGETFRLMAPKR